MYEQKSVRLTERDSKMNYKSQKKRETIGQKTTTFLYKRGIKKRKIPFLNELLSAKDLLAVVENIALGKHGEVFLHCVVEFCAVFHGSLGSLCSA